MSDSPCHASLPVRGSAEDAAQVDPELEGPTLPSQREDEFRPFVRRLPEFKFWCVGLVLPGNAIGAGIARILFRQHSIYTLNSIWQ